MLLFADLLGDLCREALISHKLPPPTMDSLHLPIKEGYITIWIFDIWRKRFQISIRWSQLRPNVYFKLSITIWVSISSFLPTTSPCHSHKGEPSFSWKCPHVCSKLLQWRPTLCNPTDLAHLAPLSMGFSRQEYWNGLSRPPLWDLPDPGIESKALTSPARAGRFFTTSTAWEAPRHWCTLSPAIRNRMYFKTPSDATFSPGNSSLIPGPAPGRTGCFLICAPTDLKQSCVCSLGLMTPPHSGLLHGGAARLQKHHSKSGTLLSYMKQLGQIRMPRVLFYPAMTTA